MSSPVRVVVSVGTDHHPFDRLMGWLETWYAAQGDGVTLFVQHGSSRLPGTADGAVLMPREELRARMGEADVVVLQAGPGGIIDALVMGRRPIVVPRLPELGEIVDGHQVAFARHLAEQDQIDVAEDEPGLARLLDESVASPGSRVRERYVVRSAETARRIGDIVEQLVASGGRELPTEG
ncbi:MAG TPA: glycosyltransferase [Candidatus Nanopelagicales bacterium]|nr:glycosyltransferase [Candidatus Nanopelagicales bacterium]